MTLCLSISILKCQLCHFTRARCGLHDIVMGVDGIEINCQDSLKYLGVVLDSRLFWTLHIQYSSSVFLLMRHVIFYLLYKSETARPDLHGSPHTPGSSEMNRLIIWLIQLPSCLSLYTVGFLWSISTPSLVENLGSGITPSGLF